ncbi:MAG: hypothetical protein R2873_07635 [Caldilineaceae bacterium]|nr:hypothetical protein [Caldilineaceae bacterium]
MSTDWLLTQLHWQQPGFWMLLSFLTGLIVLALRRFIRPERYAQLRFGRWFAIPYLGLLFGGISPRLMGLSDIDWVAGLGTGVLMIFAVLVILLLIRATLHLDEITVDERPPASPIDRLHQVIHAGVQEFHWTFLRAGTWELMLSAPVGYPQPAYWSVWIASMLALPGIFTQYQRTSQRLIASVVLLTTAILFLYTRNFWLAWLLHACTQILLGQRTRPQPTSAVPQ